MQLVSASLLLPALPKSQVCPLATLLPDLHADRTTAAQVGFAGLATNIDSVTNAFGMSYILQDPHH